MAELKRRNIGTGLHFRCVHGQKYYREAWPVPAGSLPNTEWNSERIFSLPFFPGMSDADVDDVIDTSTGSRLTSTRTVAGPVSGL